MRSQHVAGILHLVLLHFLWNVRLSVFPVTPPHIVKVVWELIAGGWLKWKYFQYSWDPKYSKLRANQLFSMCTCHRRCRTRQSFVCIQIKNKKSTATLTLHSTEIYRVYTNKNEVVRLQRIQPSVTVNNIRNVMNQKACKRPTRTDLTCDWECIRDLSTHTHTLTHRIMAEQAGGKITFTLIHRR